MRPHYNRFEFKGLFDDRLVDVVQLNLDSCGGLSEARRITKMSSTGIVVVRPHIWSSVVGIAAAVQFATKASEYPHARNIPDLMMVKCNRSLNPLQDELLETLLDLTGGSPATTQEPG